MLKITGVARGQWKQTVQKACKDNKEIDFKIIRAIVLGKKSYIYFRSETLKSHIIRYYDINILVTNNVVQTLWRDKTSPLYIAPKQKKDEYNKKHGYVPVKQYPSHILPNNQ